jgi:hypothetical protein
MDPPCSIASFEVNSEPHTEARPSVRLCVGLIKNWRTRSGGKRGDSASVIKKDLKQAVGGWLAGHPAAAEPSQVENGGDLAL